MGNSTARNIFCSYFVLFPVKVATDHAHSIVAGVEIPGHRPLVTTLHIASLIPFPLRQLHRSWSIQNFAKLSTTLKGGWEKSLEFEQHFFLCSKKKMVNVFECPIHNTTSHSYSNVYFPVRLPCGLPSNTGSFCGTFFSLCWRFATISVNQIYRKKGLQNNFNIECSKRYLYKA